MKTKKLSSGLTALLAFVLGTLPVSAATRGTASVADVPQTAAITDLGHAPPGGRIDIALTLNYRNGATLENLVELQSNPHSPLYGHFLSNQQFNAAFAPTAAAYALVVATLRRYGFQVSQVYDNNTVIDAVGTVSAADRLFSTDIHLVNQLSRGLRYANALPAREPAALRGLVASVSGLQTLTINRMALATALPDTGAVPDLAVAPLKGPVSASTGLAGFGPLAFSQGYLFPEQFKNSGGKYLDGTGRKAGVVIDADFLDSDLASFLKYFNVKRTGPKTTRVDIDGGPPSGLGSQDSLETTLDVETIVSNAPGTALYVYEFPNFSNNKYITDAYNKVVSQNIVDTANSSFGGCETAEVSDAKAWDAIALQGASKGITFHASSGDSGANECGTGKDSVSAPASGPHFAAIGGTSLKVSSTGGWSSESAWSGSGGGVSKIFGLPTWQKPISGIITSGRNLPDVAFDANPNTGAAFYYGGSWNTRFNPLGGTSLSSPLFGAALTEVNQLVGRRAGLAAETLEVDFVKKGYKNPSLPFVYFHDITSGCNGGGAPGYCAHKGFDQVTGIGSVPWWDQLK